MQSGVESKWAVIVALALIAGCGEQSLPEAVGDAGGPRHEPAESNVRRAINDLQAKVDELAGDRLGDPVQWASDDIENIGDWEYKVVEFADVPAADWEQALNDYGDDRWQLVWIDRPEPGTVTVVMKRPAVSLLSRIPLSALGRMMMRDSGVEE